VPEGARNADVLRQINDNYISEYLAFFISFAVISAHWFGHHRVFRYARSVSPSALRWNMM
jgi:TMEM175 potassium channel family protein